jgi:hypothetical protein
MGLSLANIARGAGSVSKEASKTQVADIIEFVESGWGLSFRLFPIQRILLKAHYGLELDDKDPKIPVPKTWRKEEFWQMTEAEYLRFLYNEGRANIKEIDHERREMILSIGRRSGKTTIAACISAYETYKLLRKQDPHQYYGIPNSNMISMTSVATDKDQAALLYNEVSGHFQNCAFFAPYTANNTLSYARFQTPVDIEKYGRYQDDPTARASVKITFKSCIAKGLRGPGNIVVILDEVAHFQDKGQSSADKVYDAISPSTAAFSPKDPNDHRIPIGDSEGRIILISSPLGKQGLFYTLFSIGMRGGKAARNILSIQAPTWEVNPTVPVEEFEKHFLKDANVFFTEFGGEFTDRTKGWIEDRKDLVACINPDRSMTVRAPARLAHYAGLDLGLVGDGTAIAIGHNEGGKVVADVVDVIQAGVGDFKGVERLDLEKHVVPWVYEWSRKFYIVEGVFDQWAGVVFEQALHRAGLKQLKMIANTKQRISEMFQNFKDMMWALQLDFYDHPILEGKDHCAYLEELLTLQAEVHSKYITTVEAPPMEGMHDDMSDALVRMVWLASKHLSNPHHIAGGYLGTGIVQPQMIRGRHRRKPVARNGYGSSPERRGSRTRFKGRY